MIQIYIEIINQGEKKTQIEMHIKLEKKELVARVYNVHKFDSYDAEVLKILVFKVDKISKWR